MPFFSRNTPISAKSENYINKNKGKMMVVDKKKHVYCIKDDHFISKPYLNDKKEELCEIPSTSTEKFFAEEYEINFVFMTNSEKILLSGFHGEEPDYFRCISVYTRELSTSSNEQDQNYLYKLDKALDILNSNSIG